MPTHPLSRQALDLGHQRAAKALRALLRRDPEVPDIKPAPVDDAVHAAEQRALTIAHLNRERLLVARAVAARDLLREKLRDLRRLGALAAAETEVFSSSLGAVMLQAPCDGPLIPSFCAALLVAAATTLPAAGQSACDAPVSLRGAEIEDYDPIFWRCVNGFGRRPTCDAARARRRGEAVAARRSRDAQNAGRARRLLALRGDERRAGGRNAFSARGAGGRQGAGNAQGAREHGPHAWAGRRLFSHRRSLPERAAARSQLSGARRQGWRRRASRALDLGRLDSPSRGGSRLATPEDRERRALRLLGQPLL